MNIELDLSNSNIIDLTSDLIPNTNATTIILPSTIENIYQNSFLNCKELQNIDLSKCINLKYINKYAFSNCKYIKDIDLSKCINLKKINDFSFNECYNLTKIILPNKNIEISEYAFENSGLNCMKLNPIILFNDL